ncbi:hypothetical protein RchiOBHm_Chr2g0140391 [Rosa chinensis]|uniref:Uncharacterized protein n=1 Tax=Rosa chinensis TaxID=74649 RepID=A0A2P6RXD4_ROSCH|nr:hypothetical protein RchiOBHm_Chr2g0140391 [Rosa chinensis]
MELFGLKLGFDGTGFGWSSWIVDDWGMELRLLSGFCQWEREAFDNGFLFI